MYTYLSVPEIKEMVSGIGSKGAFLLTAKEKMISRNYYQRYLNKTLKNPEFEGKQIINFIKKHE